MGKPSRTKGKTGEREIVLLAKEAGFDKAHRSWQIPQPNGDIGGIPGVHLEVRRREGLAVEAWCREVEAKANDRIPVVAWRRNGEPWRATLPLTDLLRLLYGRNDD